jgi:hypothetical protein
LARTVDSFPEDIFTEPANVDADTLANLGPLRRLAGEWRSADGVDVNPKAEGPERRQYIEHALFEPIDPQANGPQLFYGLRYHIHINTPKEDIAFHDQVGYWLWEPAIGVVIQTLSIPRGQVAIAGGRAAADDDRLVLTAERGSTEYGICSTTFLEHAFRTERYRIEVTFHDDGTWSYEQHTTLIVHGQPFDHHDRNRLTRLVEPRANPWKQILSARQSS